MDTTESYIKMCEKAEKIQNVWEMRPFDYYTMRYAHGYVNVRNIQGEGWFEKQRCGYIWLPTQSDLQGMVGKYDLPNLLVEFYCFVSGRIPKTNEVVSEPLWNKFTSMEQLWLAFVQKELHNEVWDKQEWGVEQG